MKITLRILLNSMSGKTISVLALHPSQFYISAAKLGAVRSWFSPKNLTNFVPVMIKRLDGRLVLTDGHTRAFAAYSAGLERIPFVWDEDELDWDAYRLDVAACETRGVRTVADLAGRVISPEEYAGKWIGWCDESHLFLQAHRTLELHAPAIDELSFRQEMMNEPATMSYNAGLKLNIPGYHPDTGCIDFPESAWQEWYGLWVDREPERYYAYIRRLADGAFVGEVCFRYVAERDWWEMGVVIHAPYRGNGYSESALRLLLEHAFRDAGVTRLHNCFEAERVSARRAHLAVGFRDTGVANGLRHLLLTREEYLERH